MKILCLTSSYPRHEGDIAGLFVERWRSSLQARGAQVKVLTWRSLEDDPTFGAPDVLRVPYAPRGKEQLFYGAGAPENLAATWWLPALIPGALTALSSAALAMLARERFDLIVGHWLLPCGALASALGAITKTPSVIITHSGGIDALAKLPAPLRGVLARHLSRRPVTFVSEEARARFLAITSRSSLPSSTILPMGFDLPSFDNQDTAQVTRDPRDVLIIGRLVPIKGIDDALHALARLPDVRVHIAGDGPERERLEALAATLGVAATFHGVVRGEAKRALLARCKVAIFASRAKEGRHEGLPVSLLECAGAGVWPMVASLPGASDLLVDRARQQLDLSRDPKVWAAQIQRELALGGDECESLIASQRQLVRMLSWDHLGGEWAAWLTRHCQPSTFSRR